MLCFVLDLLREKQACVHVMHMSHAKEDSICLLATPPAGRTVGLFLSFRLFLAALRVLDEPCFVVLDGNYCWA